MARIMPDVLAGVQNGILGQIGRLEKKWRSPLGRTTVVARLMREILIDVFASPFECERFGTDGPILTG